VHDELEGRAVGSEVARVLAGVEQVVRAGAVDDDAAGVGVEVPVTLGAVLQRGAVVLKLGEVLGGDEVPGGAGFRVRADLVEIEEPELSVLLEGNKVPNPSVGGLEEDWGFPCR